MIQTMKILQMNSMELENYINEQSMENPMLVLDEPEKRDIGKEELDRERKLEWLESTDLQNRVYYQYDSASSNPEEQWQDIGKKEENLSEYLKSQIINEYYSSRDRKIIDYLIDSLDSSGYCKEDLAEVARLFGVDEEHVKKILSNIQNLDPAGVGARDLKECLLLQLERIPDHNKNTETIIQDYIIQVGRNHLKVIADGMNISLEEVSRCVKEIKKLNPKPGNSFNDRDHFHYISPDIVVVKLPDYFDILLNEYQYPKFHISSYYKKLSETTEDAETKNYLKDKLNDVEKLQDNITYRSSTIARVAKDLVRRQQDFFLYGPGHKKPMKLKDLAEDLRLNISTISRTLANKYLQCSWGVYPLSYFLTSSVDNSSKKEQTKDDIIEKMKEIIMKENKKKPYSDQQICELLESEDIHISRRTVAKYRKIANIPDKAGRRAF